MEDDPDVRAAIAEILALDGYCVAEAADGAEGLACARSDHPDLILLDLMMPGLNGWEFRAKQEADPSISEIPVVVVTACPPQDPHVQRVHPAAYLYKPFDVDDLLRAVHALCAPAGQ